MTSNNTIEGTEYTTLPQVGDVPLVSDNSSDMFSGPLDVGKHGLIYAGAQKNMGPAGVTLVIIREDLVARSAGNKSLKRTLAPRPRTLNDRVGWSAPSFDQIDLPVSTLSTALQQGCRLQWH